MLIFHLITGLGSGGAERMLARIVTAAAGSDPHPARHLVVSLMDEGIYGQQLRAVGVELHSLQCRRGKPSLTAFFKLVALLRKRQPDVVMTWLYHADLAGIISVLLSGIGTHRLVWNLRCSNMELDRYGRLTRAILRVLASVSRFPWGVATNSHAGQTYHQSLGYRPKRWIYLPNGFDVLELRPDVEDRAAVRDAWGMPASSIAVGMFARVDPMKDHGTFFEAAQLLTGSGSDIRFVLVGKGTDEVSVPVGLENRVITMGERRDVARLLRGLDMLVLCSAFGEGLPNIVGEAMATSVPCVVTDVGDAAAIVGDTGIAVRVRSPGALADAVRTLSSETPEQRARRGRDARNRIVELYNLDRSVEAYSAVWTAIAHPSPGRTHGPHS